MSHNCIIWQVQDGKPGHVNQMRGLSAALSKHLPLNVHEISAPPRRVSWKALITGKFPTDYSSAPPDLILGAGHGTHVTVLALKRAYGGKAIVLMKPTLPARFFDLCLVPRHDRIASSPNVVHTLGVLNTIVSSNSRCSRHGLFLIGGPSATYGWDHTSMTNQIAAIVAADPTFSWNLTTSRRTPYSLVEKLRKNKHSNLSIVMYEETSPGWVQEHLAYAEEAWVSADSVSMVYEALTSGAAVGVLDAPCKRPGRVAAGIDAIVDEGWATPYSTWQQNKKLKPVPVKLNEACRCAEIVAQRFLSRKIA